MPKVGAKHFSYGPKGMAAAKAASKKTGMPMKMMDTKEPKGDRAGKADTKRDKRGAK